MSTRPVLTQGFTLIELMIVVAIIGILSSIAIPSYQAYVAKAKFTAALHEVQANKTGIEALLNEGTLPTLADIGVSSSTENCSNVLTASLSGDNVIVCTIVGGPAAVNGQTITITRDSSAIGLNHWSCSSSVAQKYIGSVQTCHGV